MPLDQQALKDWLMCRQFTVFGTLKFTDGFNINSELAEKLVRKYFNALDRTYYGNAAFNSNVRHDRAVFLHKGKSQQNIHYHFLAKPNTDALLYCRLARKLWGDLGTRTIGYLDTQIEMIKNGDAAVSYMLHEYRELGTSTVFTAASFFAAAELPVRKYRNIHQLRRLLTLDCGI